MILNEAVVTYFTMFYQHLTEGTEQTKLSLRKTGLLVDKRTGNSRAITTSRIYLLTY